MADFWEVKFYSVNVSRVKWTDLIERCPGSLILSEIEKEGEIGGVVLRL